MPLLNYTTEKTADQSIATIQKILSRMNASKIMTDFEEGEISAISFALPLNGQTIAFRIPCDWRKVYAVLVRDITCPYKYDEKKIEKWKSDKRMQSVRVAWRIVKDWIEAQMAIIETEMVKTEQVFLPYMITSSGETLYQHIAANQFRLGDGK